MHKAHEQFTKEAIKKRKIIVKFNIIQKKLLCLRFHRIFYYKIYKFILLDLKKEQSKHAFYGILTMQKLNSCPN